MSHEHGIVRPVRTRRSPSLSGTAVLAATETDFRDLAHRMDLPDTRSLFISRLRFNAKYPELGCLAGPLTGSPYAAMLLETLRTWGVTQSIFMGWCGAIHGSIKAGDIIIPRSAIIDEGTSLDYQQHRGARVDCDGPVTDTLCQRLQHRGLNVHQGAVWTTDAIFRETPSKVKHFRAQGALAVEMELSALFSVARFYNLAAAAVLVVSDELATLQWRPGFRDAAFKQSRRTICDLLAEFYGGMRNHGY